MLPASLRLMTARVGTNTVPPLMGLGRLVLRLQVSPQFVSVVPVPGVGLGWPGRFFLLSAPTRPGKLYPGSSVYVINSG